MKGLAVAVYNIREFFGHCKILKYALCSSISLIFLYSAIIVLNTAGIPYLYASTAAYYLSLLLDFYLQKNFTFKNRDNHYKNLSRQWFLFFTIRIINGGLYALLLKFLYLPEKNAASYFLAPMIALIITGLINFSFDNYITFKYYKKITLVNARKTVFRIYAAIKSGSGYAR